MRLGDENLLEAGLGMVRYDGGDNRFVADLFDIRLAGVDPASPFFDPLLALVASPALSELAGILDSRSSTFQPDTILHLSYRPDIDVWAATNGFTGSGQSPITNLVFTQRVAAPATSTLMMAAGAVLFTLRRHRTMRRRDPATRPVPRAPSMNSPG